MTENEKLKPEHLEWISGVAEGGKKKYKDTIKEYEIWREYVARSKDYNKICEWFKDAKSKHQIDKNFEFDSFVDTCLAIKGFNPPMSLGFFYNLLSDPESKAFLDKVSNSFFSILNDEGFPFKAETLMNYFIFGDTSTEEEPYRTFRLVLMIEANLYSTAYNLNGNIDILSYFAENLFKKTTGKDPSVEDFKKSLEFVFENDPRLFISITDPSQNKEIILERVSQLIDENRNKSKEELSGRYEKETFTPSGKLHLDDLQKYLAAFDLQKKGKSIDDIGKIMEVSPAALPSSIQRSVSRYLQRAKKIISNVEQGFFPGNYT